MTATRLDFDDTVGAVGTPLGGTGSILQDRDALNVLRVNLKQRRELLLVVHVGKVISVLFVLRDLEDMVVEDNQRLCITIDGAGTTQTHGRTGTKVTGVRHDVQTCNLTLQGLVHRLEGETFHVVHLEVLDCTGILACWNLQTRGRCILLTCYRDLGDGFSVVLQGYLEYTLAASYLLDVLFVADIGNLKRIVGILDIHGEVTIHIGDCLTDNTIVLIFLHDVGTDDNVNVIRNGT